MNRPRVAGLRFEPPWNSLDPGIRPVVVALQHGNVETIASCQGHGHGDAWVTCTPGPGETAVELATRVAEIIDRAGWADHALLSITGPFGSLADVRNAEAWVEVRWWGEVPFR